MCVYIYIERFISRYVCVWHIVARRAKFSLNGHGDEITSKNDRENRFVSSCVFVPSLRSIGLSGIFV